MKRLFLALVVGLALAGCGPEPQAEGWRGLAWWTPQEQAAKKLNDVEFKWRLVESAPAPDFDAISDPKEREAAKALHFMKRVTTPRVEDRSRPPEKIMGTLRDGSCFYRVTLIFDEDGELNEVTEGASLHCSDAAKNELTEKFGKPTFSEAIAARDCGIIYARGVMETVAWTKGGTRAVYERRCGADRFTVEYFPLRQ